MASAPFPIREGGYGSVIYSEPVVSVVMNQPSLEQPSRDGPIRTAVALDCQRSEPAKTGHASSPSRPGAGKCGEVAERGRVGPEPICGPLLSRYGDRTEFSASPPSLRATGSRKPTGAGFWWRPAGLVVFPTPTSVPHSALSVVSPRRAEGVQASRAPGFRSPRAVRRPHAPDIPQVTGFKPRKGPGDDSGTTFPARSHPAAR